MTFTKQMGEQGYGEVLIPPGMEGINMTFESEFHYNYEIDICKSESIAMSDLEEWPYEIDTTHIASDTNKEKFSYPPSGKYTFASMRPLGVAELMKYTKQELYIMRNEIFARYGYIFKSEELNQYFHSQQWYSPERENVDKFITNLEKNNLELIARTEKTK